MNMIRYCVLNKLLYFCHFISCNWEFVISVEDYIPKIKCKHLFQYICIAETNNENVVVAVRDAISSVVNLCYWIYSLFNKSATVILSSIAFHCFLPPARFLKRREVLFWGPSPSPPSPRMFCFISQLLLKLGFWNLTCLIDTKTIFPNWF